MGTFLWPSVTPSLPPARRFSHAGPGARLTAVDHTGERSGRCPRCGASWQDVGVSEDAQHRATEFLKGLYAAGRIDEDRLDSGVAELLAATSDAEVAEVVRALPPPVALTSPDRRLDRPLEIHSGMRRLRLAGRWQLARETHLSADLGSVRVDLTEAEFDDRVIDLHVYTGWGSITIIVPRGVAVQVIHHRGGVDSRLEPPVPGLPLIRLDVTTNIGQVRLRHPGPPGGKRRGRDAITR
jgi:hypothetical protein